MGKKKVEKEIIVDPEKVKKVKIKPDKPIEKVNVEPDIKPAEVTESLPTNIIKNVAVIGFDKHCNNFIKNHSKDIDKKYYKITKVEDIKIDFDYYIKTHRCHDIKEYGFIMNIFKQKIKENGR